MPYTAGGDAMADNFITRLTLRKKDRATISDEERPSVFQQQLAKFKFEPDHINAFQDRFRRVTNQFDTPGPRMERTEDFNVGEGEDAIPCRLFVPYGADEPSGPCLIYFHGGGFVMWKPMKASHAASRMERCAEFYRLITASRPRTPTQRVQRIARLF
jgi:acetyl esterase/lipase